MLIKFIALFKNIKIIINDFIDKPSILFLLIKIYYYVGQNEMIRNELKNESEEDEYLIKIINKCEHCKKIINEEMYCYKDKYYCSEKCRCNYYE